MRVLLVEIWDRGGTAVYARELAIALAAGAKSSDEVHLAGPAQPGGKLPGVVTHFQIPVLTGGKSGSKIVRGIRYLIRWRQQQRAIEETIRDVGPDVVHFLGTTVASGSVYRCTRRMKVPSVVTVHDLPRGGDSRASEMGLRFTSSSFTSASRILVHGQWTLSNVRDTYGSKVAAKTRVVPFGLFDIARVRKPRQEIREKFGIPAGAIVLLFFGNIRANKGLADLLEAFDSADAPNLWLIVAGRAEGKGERPSGAYAEEFRNRRSAPRVAWVARSLTDSEIGEVFAMSDAVVLPYHASFGSQSAVLSLAIASGTPVVATDVGEIGPTVRHYELGICVAPGSISRLTQALVSFAAKPIQVPDERFLRARDDMSWTSAAAAMWSEYHQCVDKIGESASSSAML